MATKFLGATYKHFEKITDPRINRGHNYPLIESIFLTLCATICGANGWNDVERFGKAKLPWLRRFLPFEFGVPSHDTLGRIFARLDSVEFYAAIRSWLNLFVKGNQPTLEQELEDAILVAFNNENKHIRQQQTREKNRNRDEFRRMIVMPVPKGSAVFAQWPGSQIEPVKSMAR